MGEVRLGTLAGLHRALFYPRFEESAKARIVDQLYRRMIQRGPLFSK